MLLSAWQVVSMFNPAMYLISGFRWAFFGVSEVPIQVVFGGDAICGTVLRHHRLHI